MVSWLQKISSGNQSRMEEENAEMTVPNYRYRDLMNRIWHVRKNIVGERTL